MPKSLLHHIHQVSHQAFAKYSSLSASGKILVWIFILFHTAFLAFFIIYSPSAILQSLYDFSQTLKGLPFGWLLIGTVMVALSFPPLPGYSTCTTLCGFAYGLNGFLVAAPATLVGSGLAFISLRKVFRQKLKLWSSQNEKWRTLEQLIAAEGLMLIILIRVSPFPPYVYSQALFASISSVRFWQFMLATIFYLSRIFLSIFIGSRMAMFSDKSQRVSMDSTTKVINGFSMVGGIILGIGLAWFLYRTVNRKIQEAQEHSMRNSFAEGIDIPLLVDNTVRGPSLEDERLT